MIFPRVNINKYNDIFVTDIIRVGLKFQQIVTFVIGIWDIINDVFLAAIVDKTRTVGVNSSPGSSFMQAPACFAASFSG